MNRRYEATVQRPDGIRITTVIEVVADAEGCSAHYPHPAELGEIAHMATAGANTQIQRTFDNPPF